MLEINMNPSKIAWEKEDTVLMTPAGVAHTCKGEIVRLGREWTRAELVAQIKKPLSDHFIILKQSYGISGYDVNVVEKEDRAESYVSLVAKKFVNAHSVEDYNKAYGIIPLDENDKKYGRYYSKVIDINQPYSGSHGDGVTVESETRVYPDKRVAVLFKATYPASGHARYFMLRVSHFSGRRWSLINDGVKNEDEWFGDKEKFPNVIEILSEDEIHKNAAKNTNRLSMVMKGIGFNDFGDDLKCCMTMDCDNHYGYKFDSKTRDAINDLMGVFTPEEGLCRSIFDDKYEYADGSHRDVGAGITSPIFLDKWTMCRDSAALAEKKKAADLAALWPSIHWGPTSPEGARNICWERRTGADGDFIIAAYSDDHRRWGPTKAAFIYDVRKKTRKVVTNSGPKGAPQSVIPALKNCILQQFNFATGRKWDPESGSYVRVEGPTQSIVGGISVRELFAGTNVAWIMDNEKEFGDDLFYLFKDTQDWWGECKIHTIQDDIREGGDIGVVALCILATTGNVMLEQLLKSRMFRMYFLALASEAGAEDIFWDVSKKVQNRHDGCPFPYTSKGKNPKEMFGMSLTQLRVADKAIEIVKEDSRGGETRFRYKYPRYGYVADVLGVERLSALDDRLFVDVTEMTKNDKSSSYWSGYRINCIHNRDEVMRYLEHNTPKERLAFIKGFASTDEISKFDDYLRMRTRMIELQKSRPTEDIFDDKSYPRRVGKAVKFIRFMPGMRGEPGWYGGTYCEGTIDTQEQFIDSIKKKYAAYATEKGSVQLELNEDGHVAGAIIKMNPLQHMNFLHDEMSQWYAMYNDDSKVEEFRAATKRVSEYEWSDDEDTGLCIVGPKDPADLRKEGSVLSHCVASYVNPIIAGSHNIMFIRRADMADEPYYTLDINGAGEVTEVHGYRNCNMEDADVDAAYAETGREVYSKHFNIKKFLHNWAKAMKGKVKEKSLRGTYGKLDIIA